MWMFLHLNTVLQLHEDPGAPYSVPIMRQRGCLLRMKCIIDILGGQINKAWLPLRYKFLLHILIQCLSNRRSGVGGSKFWMYPRFLQMIINVQHPNLPKSDNDILKIDAMLKHSLKIFRGVASKLCTESTPPWKMFGALANTAYIAPTNDKWHHDDSRSNDEEPKLKKMIEDKFGQTKVEEDDESDNSDGDDEGGDGGNVGASGASKQPGGNNDESDSDDNPPEPGYEHYFDERDVRKVRRIRTNQDGNYVPSDTESERLRKKKATVCRKKRSKKTIGASSAEPATTQHDPMTELVLEADVNPQFAFREAETVAMMTSPTAATETPLVTTIVAETPVVTPKVEP
ncbi:hypothetical protein Hanom_Chr07g00601781 [Helianthus anomalus]